MVEQNTTMSGKAHYITHAAEKAIPLALQNLLWLMNESVPESRYYLQIFELSPDNGMQRIVHRQEYPAYTTIQTVSWEAPIAANVLIIDEGPHCTMLLEDEH